MNGLQWYQRLPWRGAATFVILLILVETPFWILAEHVVGDTPERAASRALGLATVGALVTVLLQTVVAHLYLERRLDAARRVLLGAAAGDRSISRFKDEVSVLADDVGVQMHKMRTSLVRLQQEKGRLSTLLEGMGEAVLMTDDAERVLLANSVAVKLLGLPKRYQGKRLSDVCEIPQVMSVVSEVLWALESSSIEVDITVKDDVRHISVEATPILSGDAATGAVVVLYDLTRLRRLERVRRDFVANVSHELRTPIAAVRSVAETLLMNDKTNDPVVLDFLRTIERNAVRMGTIVEDLLMLSRLEAAGSEIELRAVNLASVFAEIVDRCDPLAKDNGVILNVEIEEGFPEVFAEAGALRQILQNLVENAIKYTPRGGTVTMRANKKGRKRARIRVTDTGQGISEEHLPRIFERFYRVDAGRSRDVGGTGLGLAIVKHLVRKLKGRISVESDPEKGTQFTLWLRLYRPEKAQ